jgi:hypothetical protein
MHRGNHYLILLCCLLCILSWGCSSQAPPKQAATDPKQTAVEARLRDGLKLKEVHMTETGQDQYEGTGMGENGMTYRIKATYRLSKSNGTVKSRIDYEAEDSKGGGTKGYEEGPVSSR